MVQKMLKMKNTNLTFLALNPEIPTLDSFTFPFRSFLEIVYKCRHTYPTHRRHMEAFRKSVTDIVLSLFPPHLAVSWNGASWVFFCSGAYGVISRFGGYVMCH